MAGPDRSVLGALASVLTGRVGSVAVGITATPLLVRLLGPSAYGEYAFAMSVLSLGAVGTDLGTSDGVRKFVAETSGTERTAVVGFYARMVGIAATVGGGALALLDVVATRLDVVDPGVVGLLSIVGVALIGRAWFRLLRNTLMGISDERFSEPLTVLRRVMAEFGAVAVAAGGLGVVAVLFMEVVGAVTATVVAVIFLCHRVELDPLRSTDDVSLSRRRLFGFSVGSWFVTLLFTSLYHVDLLFVRTVLGARNTGYYRAALQTAEFVWFFPFALQLVLLQSVSERWGAVPRAEVKQLTERITRYTVAGTVLVAVGIGTLAEPFLRLYFGTEFVAAAPIVMLLLPGVIAFAVARPLVAVVQASGQLGPLIVGSGLVAVGNVVGNALAVPQFGLAGAAAVTASSYAAVLVVTGTALRRIGCLPRQELGLLGTLAAGGITLAVLLLGRTVPAEPTLTLLVLPPLGGICYVIVLLTTGVVRPAELRQVSDRLPGSLGRLVERLSEFVDG